MPDVYDCFPVYNEFDLVELRVDTLRDVVDTHIAVVSDITHAGHENPHYNHWVKEENEECGFYRLDKRLWNVLVYFRWDRMKYESSVPATRRREMFQRNGITDALEEYNRQHFRLKPDDIILISDADEIPNPAIVAQLAEQGLPEGVVVIFRQRLCYYDLNTTQGYRWQGTRAVRWDDLRALTPHVVRYGLGAHDEHYPKYGIAQPGGWHLSYFGGAERVREKMVNFLHQELVNEDTADAEKIAERIAAAQDIYGRSDSEWTVERTIDVPPPVLANPERWRHLWRSGYEPEGA
jgi:beta-1,4-mannosyl-glycoprotein beta-1,4-N-acetylglucosaminyltransferase